MPLTTSALLWASLPLVLAATIYQVGNPITDAFFNTLVGKIILNIFYSGETRCYTNVKTLTPGLPDAHCFSVSNGRFTRVFVDDTSFDHVREARTGYAYPGLWDGHGHLQQYGELMHSVDLFGADSMDEVHKRLLEYKTTHEEAGTSEHWLRGVGWDQANYGRFPVASDLEINDEFKDQYVMLDRIDVHCIWVSEKVLSLLPTPLPDIPGGEIPEKGIFCDNAMDIVLEHYPSPSPERRTRWIKDAMFELNKLGIVGMHDAGVRPAELELYAKLVHDEDWNVRVNAMIECDTRNTFCPETARKVEADNGKLHIRSVKIFGDGALGSWGSAMIEPYSDKPESSGTLLINATTLNQLVQEWSSLGYQVNVHAIGDLANRNAIDAFAAAYKVLCPDLTARECQEKHRFRIEHAQIIHPDDQKRMFEMGIIPSIQPTHATSDMPYVESRLGKDRTTTEAYRMRSLLPLHPVLGSDFPVEPPNIFEGIYAAVTRRSPKADRDPAVTDDIWYPEEALSFTQALQGFTLSPAYAAFLDGKAGAIQEGAYADWIVLDEPLEDMDMDALKKATVKETWVGGKLVYKRAGPAPLPWMKTNNDEDEVEEEEL